MLQVKGNYELKKMLPKRRIRILLGVVASIQHILGQIGQASPEGQLVLGDALLCFWIL